ncbi:hypothetical protein MKW94_003973, partial [Papaver nudicaule]|nr:hypothetical protein [Papaver nudicaule]
MMKKNIKPSTIRPPEPAGAWPIIGHLRLLGGPDLPHITLGKMADKYGPIFAIRIGSNPTVVVSSSEVAKEIFTTNNKIWASKPKVIGAMKHMVYDTAMYGFSPYGPYWSKINKIVMQKLLSNSRLELIKHVWSSEINSSMKQLYEKVASGGENSVDMKNCFSVLTTDMSIRLIAGKRCFGGEYDEVSRRFQIALSNFFRLVAVFVPSDAVPILRGWIDLGGYESEMKRTRNDLDCILSQMLEEHKKKRSGEETHEGSNEAAVEEDFMDVMLSVFEEDPKLMSDCDFDADTIIKATSL